MYMLYRILHSYTLSTQKNTSEDCKWFLCWVWHQRCNSHCLQLQCSMVVLLTLQDIDTPQVSQTLLSSLPSEKKVEIHLFFMEPLTVTPDCSTGFVALFHGSAYCGHSLFQRGNRPPKARPPAGMRCIARFKSSLISPSLKSSNKAS